MKLKSIISQDNYSLEIELDNSEIRYVDYTDHVNRWLNSGNPDLVSIANNFNTAFVNEKGDLAFRDGETELFFTAAQVYDTSTTMRTRKPSSKSATTTRQLPKIKQHPLGTISSTEVLKTVSHGLPFTGEWYEFLGEPAKNFYMILSAQPGHGKTTFCLKFANYLTRFGRVLYNTNEEDAARVKTKLKFIKDKINQFDISFEPNTIDELMDLIKRGKYDFVFIDSAQYGGMDYKELRKLRESFPDIAIIAICRQTKDGKSRGSQEKEYDGDITVKFYEQGCAHTVKNRFWQLADYQLF